MLRNFFVVMLRNLRKSRSYSVINMAGLSIGITCSILILLWVHDELSYNRFLPKADRLYKVMANVTYDGKINTWGAVALPAYDVLKTENSRITNTCAADWGSDHLLAVGENKIRKQGHYVTEEFLSMFEFPLLKGNRSNALSDPGSVVISASAARALFGEEDPINRIIRVDNAHEQKVTGVMADVPKNSSFQFDCLLPWVLYESDPWIKRSRTSWESYSFGVYVELSNAQSRKAVDETIKNSPARYAKTDGTKREFFLYPFTEWRLYSVFENGIATRGRIEYVELFSIIAVFILVMACINFMNLSTARSERMAKAVGIRKSVGSSRGELIIRL